MRRPLLTKAHELKTMFENYPAPGMLVFIGNIFTFLDEMSTYDYVPVVRSVFTFFEFYCFDKISTTAKGYAHLCLQCPFGLTI